MQHIKTILKGSNNSNGAICKLVNTINNVYDTNVSKQFDLINDGEEWPFGLCHPVSQIFTRFCKGTQVILTYRTCFGDLYLIIFVLFHFIRSLTKHMSPLKVEFDGFSLFLRDKTIRFKSLDLLFI